MNIKELNKVLSEALNESKEDDKNALANFLEIDVKDLEDKPDFYGMSQFSSKEDGETYAISSDEELIEKNVAEHMENLFDDLGYEEFCKEVIPYLYGNMEDYMTIDFRSMARDVIAQYGAGHELAHADNVTDEVEYNGKTYYIFREDFTKKLNKVNPLKEDAKDFKIGDFVFCRANFRYGFIKDFDGRLYTVDFVCSDNGTEEMAKTDKISIGYFEDGKARLEAQIADLERQLAAKKKIKEKFVK